MNQHEIIKLAMEYGFTGGFDAQGNLTSDATFVEAVLEAIQQEREACAKICEEMRDAWVNRPVPLLGYAVEHDGAAKAIRARGEA